MEKKVAIIGYYSALAAFFAAVGYGIVQVLQIAGLLVYPLDARLIYGFSLAIAPSFLLAVLALHYSTPGQHRFFSHAALLFALLYTVYVILMYGIQLATVIPASLKDARETLLTVTPHSLFWTVDALGYICMGTSTLMAYFALPRLGQTLWLRGLLLANGLTVPLICFAYFYPHFSVWVLLAGSPWLITAPGSLLLLALYFKSNKQN